MKNLTIKSALGCVSIVLLAACGTPNQGMYGGNTGYGNAGSVPVNSASSASGFGVVQSIEAMSQEQASRLGLGTVAGAVIGGVLGNQVGSGSGRTAATVAGAVGGAYAGNQMEQGGGGSAANPVYRITVRMDNGALQTIAQGNVGGLQVGERVRLSGGSIVERFR